MDKNKKESEALETKETQKVSEENIIQLKESEYKKLLEEVSQSKDKYIRLLAEFDNASKRMERERLEFVRYANEELILEFLHILDNLERTIEAARMKHKEDAPFIQGVEMVMKNIHEMLKKNGVKPVAAVGKVFDPHAHEIMLQEPSESLADGTVMEELQKGYSLGDKVIRTAKVKVAVHK